MTCQPKDHDAAVRQLRLDELIREAQEARRGRDRWRTVGSTLTRIRAEFGMSTREIARQTGISLTTVVRLSRTSRTGVRSGPTAPR